ncbi:peptidase S8/S53 domain-containing protein [Cercophora newfieldiana]|uniref:Peptidase S8/S53 domain-containing protein n=1 Tax=Cercophora newfieldiana TaxID=92897 RepID=A0AA39Y6J4_9PEZI|nr:peptidase S8/S53 domain-containing protein [Cercophora newfieldiana]
MVSEPSPESKPINTDYILVKVTGPLEPEHFQALEEKEVKTLEYLGDNTYLCGYKPPTLKGVLELRDFVVSAEKFDPGYVVASDLKPTSSEEQDEEAKVLIALHDDISEGFDAIVAKIASEAGVPLSTVSLMDKTIQLTVPKGRLEALAEMDEVKAINEAQRARLFNNVATKIMECHKPIGTSNTVFKGDGQVVCVADTGFDKGDKTNCHKAFKGRVLHLTSLGRPAKNLTDDPAGHGTHVCGSVLGDASHADQGQIEAPASKAKLIVQSSHAEVKSADGTIKHVLKGLGKPAAFLGAAVELGAHIHTNSWGSADPGPYNPAGTGEIDNFLWANKTLVVLFAAGNEGVDVDANKGTIDPGSLSEQAHAKNCITVGASESLRVNIEYPGGVAPTWSDWNDVAKNNIIFPYEPVGSDHIADNPEGMAAWSSRGPATPQPRIKPDVVAPGSSILSARSGAVKEADEGYGISKDPAWCYMGGTSMATPLVAGCCACIREALVKVGKIANPSSALVKAVLINGAVPILGQYRAKLPGGEFEVGKGNDIPNYSTGWGRVNLNNSLQHVVPSSGVAAGFVESTPAQALSKDGTHPTEHTFPLTVPSGTSPQTLKVTLVWSDYNPSQGNGNLQNDLDLIVATADGKQKWHGNMGGPAPSTPDLGKHFDRINNVEQVRWKDVKPGVYKVTVRAYNVPFGPQPFAVAWRVVV